MTILKPALYKAATETSASGRNRTSSQFVTYAPSGAFSMMTPSRSRNTAMADDRLGFGTNDLKKSNSFAVCVSRDVMLSKQIVFYELAKNVPKQNVRLLNSRRLIGG